MYVTNEDVEAMKRILFRKAPRNEANRPLEFTIRPISSAMPTTEELPRKMRTDLIANSRFGPTGLGWIESEVPVETIARLD